MNVTILGNFDIEEGLIIPAFQHAGMWYDYFTGDSLDVINQDDSIMLEAGEYRIYTDKKLVKPEIGTGIFENDLKQKMHFKIYPNPASAELNIEILSKDNLKASVRILDLNGREIHNYGNMNILIGLNSLKLNLDDSYGNKLKSGIYFIEIGNSQNKSFQKLMVR